MTLQAILPDEPSRPEPASPWRRFSYLMRVNSADPTLLLGLVLLAIFGYLILAPVALLLVDAVTVHFPDIARSKQDLGAFALLSQPRPPLAHRARPVLVAAGQHGDRLRPCHRHRLLVGSLGWLPPTWNPLLGRGSPRRCSCPTCCRPGLSRSPG